MTLLVVGAHWAAQEGLTAVAIDVARAGVDHVATAGRIGGDAGDCVSRGAPPTHRAALERGTKLINVPVNGALHR